MPISIPGGVLCLGNVVFDILVRPVDSITWNTSHWVESLEEHLGGNGANTSYTLAILGAPVRLMTVAGRDTFGDRLLAMLEKVGVGLSAVTRSELPTPATVGLVNPAGDRFLLHRPGASREAFLDPIRFDSDLTRGMSHFHLANAFALPALRGRASEVLRQARQAGLTTSLDAGWDSQGRWLADIGPCLPHTDLLFANEDEASRLGCMADSTAAACALLKAGASAVVVKLGARGCSVFSSDAEFSAPAFEVEAMDTTGAGDCFVGGFLAGLRHGRSYKDAASFANAVAAMSVQHLGATGGLRSYEQTLGWMRNATLRATHDQS